MEYLYCSLIGYCIGAFSPAYLIGKKKGVDIRAKGSGNAGASNVLILFGKAAGFLCAILDIAKTWFAAWLAKRLFPFFDHSFAITATACILGHIFPFYMGFRGGKGLACLGGAVLFYDGKVFLILLAVALLVVIITNYICFVPITVSVLFPVIYGIMKKDAMGAVVLGIVAVVIFCKHRENLERIRKGTELHLSFLWKPKSEVLRIRQNLLEDDVDVDEIEKL